MASMNDVARRAEVSIASVSRVLNNSDNVNDETRARILKAIKELKYQPSRVAKRLRSKTGGGNLLGVLIPDIQNPFYVDVFTGIEDVAYLNNYGLIMCNFSQDEKKEAHYLNILESEAIDGLIAAPVNEDDLRVKKIVRSGLPVVCVDRGLKGVDVDVVCINNEDGAFKAVTYMLEQGYQRIAYIGGLSSIPSSRLREAGYRKALELKGIPVDADLVVNGKSGYASGVKYTKELLNLSSPPDALFTGNNLITLGALEVINSRKMQIPQDIAVLGFDDMNWSNALNPPLSAVKQPAYEIGKRAGELLFQRIKDPRRPSILMSLNSELMIRRSC